MIRWTGWLDECAHLWARWSDETCTSYTAQHMCVDVATEHELPGHTCRCGRRLEPARRPLTRKQRRALRDAKFPHDTPEAFQS